MRAFSVVVWRRWLALLALALLLMQQAGLRHALDHALNDDGGIAHVACLTCASHHLGDQATPPAWTPPPVWLAVHPAPAVTPLGRADAPLALGFQPRAPPFLLA